MALTRLEARYRRAARLAWVVASVLVCVSVAALLAVAWGGLAF